MISVYDIKIDSSFSLGTGTTLGLVLFDAGSNGRLNISTDNILEGTNNLFYTNSRAINSVLTTYSLNSSGVVSTSDSIVVSVGKLQYQINNKENTLTAGLSTQYYRGDKVWATLDKTAVGLSNVDNTSDLNKPISTATQTALNNKINTSLIGANSGVASLDSGGKVPVSQLPSSVLGAMIYQGAWNASTNTPTLASGTGTKGFYYIVSVAGTTTIDTVNDWKIGDWIVFDGTGWDKIDNTDAISSFNGRTGAITLTSSDVTTALTYTPYNSSNPSNYITSAQAPVQTVFGRSGTVVATSGDYNTSLVTENTNLYFTNARAISALLSTYTVGTNTAISTSDSVVSAFGKVQAQLNNKQNTITLGTTAQYFKGDLSLGTLDTLAVVENTNLYFTTSRVLNTALTGYAVGTNSSIASTDTILGAFGKTQAQINNKENSITAGTTLQYYRGDKTFTTLNTSVVPESGNLYYTNARTITSSLTGFISSTGTITSADTVLSAIQKLYGNTPSLTVSAPLTYSAGNISLSQANGSTSGYITSADYNAIYNAFAMGGNTVTVAKYLGLNSAFDLQIGTNSTVALTVKTGSNLLEVASGIVVNNLTASKLVFTDSNKQLTSTGIGTSSQFIKADGSLDSASYLPLSGGTLTGNLILNADPSLALGAATKQYVDNLITGLSWKNSVDYATTSNITTLSGLITVDGFTVSSGDRILVKDQTTQTLNGIYIASASGWSRSADADTANEIIGATVYVEKGTNNIGTQWSCSNTSITLGTTNITFVKIAGSGTYTNGNGILLSSNVFSVDSTKVPYYASLSSGLVRYNGSAWVFDTNTYLTGNQSIVLSGDISGTGTTAISTTIGNGVVTNAKLLNSSITVGSTNISLGATASTIAGLTLTSPTINGGTHTAITSFGIRSTGTGAFDISVNNSENLTAGRALTLVLNDANRTLNLGGNLVTTNNITFNTSGASTVTLPTTGTLATLAGTEALTNKTIGTTNTIGGVTMTLGSDAIGDIYYRNSSGILTRLGIGTTGQYLGVSTGLPAWSTPGYISSLNGLTASSQTFINDTNVTIVSNTASHTITWTGTLADNRIASASTWNAKQNALAGTGFVRSTVGVINYVTGTASQFMKADGSLDSSTYALSSALSNYVDLSNNQTVGGIKSFTSPLNLTITDNVLLTQNTNRIILSIPTYRSSYIGHLAGSSTSTGTDNVGLGHTALTVIGVGTDNTAIGSKTLSSAGIATNNTAIGSNSMNLLTSGNRNIGVGANTLKAVLTNNDNVAIGFNALTLATSNNNTAIGSYAGASLLTGANNVFIGYQAGFSELGSNKLYISNNNTSNPLIWGDFSTKALTFNGDISITNSADITKKLTIDTGTNTTSGISTILAIQSSGNRTLSFPISNVNDTIVLATTTQSLSNKTISTSNILGNVTMALGSDATGDIYYRNVSGVLTRLGIGANNQVLTISSGLPTWSAVPNSISTLNGLTATSQTFVNDTNVTIVSNTTSHTITWSGTLADSRITSASNWNTAFNNRITSLTTTGNSGASTLVSNVLNIPNYTLAGLNGQPLATNLTSLSGLTFTSTSFVKMTSAGTFSLDTNTYLPTSGGTLTGNLILNADPSLALGAATKQYVDNLITGLSWKTAVKCATISNRTLSGTQTIDGITVSVNDRVLVKNQTNQAENGIYIVQSGAWIRSEDANTGTEILTATVLVDSGSQASTQWTCSNTTTPNMSTDPITFVQISGAGTYINGQGISLVGNVFYIAPSTITNAMLEGSIASTKLIGTDISTIGTITSGVWNGTSISDTYISSASNWNTAYTNRITSLTNTGNSGASTLVSNVLNIPNYTLTGLGGQPLATNLTSLSGLTFASTSFVKMTASGTFALDTNTYLTGNQTITLSGDISGTGTTAITTTIGANKVTNSMLAGSIASSKLVGTDISTVGNITTGTWNGTSIADNKIVSSSNWNTAYTNRITSLSTTGNSGSATLISNVLNIPTYTLAGLGGVAGSGTTNQVAYFNATGTITSNSNLFFNGTSIGMGTTTPTGRLEIVGSSTSDDTFFTRYGADGIGYNIVGRKARGTSGTPTAINNDDIIVSFGGRGYGTSAWSSANRAEMSFVSSQAWTNTAQGTYISWFVTPNNATVMSEAMTLTDTSLTAPSFIKSGGTSSQFLKADGSVDSNTYALNSALSNYVTLSTTQTISGVKSFSSDISVSGMKVGRTAGTGGNLTIFGLNALSSNNTGAGNTAIGQSALLANDSGNNNTVVGFNNLYNNTTGNANVSIGAGVLGNNISGSSIVAVGNAIDVTSDGLTNVIGIGYGASLTTSNTIVMGNASITNMKTAGTFTAGAVTYPNTHGTNGQVLTTTGSGALTWTTVSSGGTYTAGNGLTLTGSSFSINTAIVADLTTAQSLTNKKLGSLTANGFVRTNNSDGTLSVDSTSYLPLTGGTLTNTLTLNNSATTGQPTFLGLINSTSDSLNFRYTEQAVSNIVADTWQMRIGGTSARRFAITYFDTFEFLNTSGTTSTNATINMPSTTTSTSTTTGALVVGGGIGAGGSVYASSFVRNGGTSSQFLKADGSVDSNTYALNSALSNYVDLSNNQTIAGVKTFSNDIIVNGLRIGKGSGNIDNTAIGINALNANTTGNNNTAVGKNASLGNLLGSNITAIGDAALINNVGGTVLAPNGVLPGNNNTAVGAGAGNLNTTGNSNTYIGYLANSNTGSDLRNSTALGANATVTTSDTIQLGNGFIASVRTTGTLTLGAVTYPKAHGTSGEVLMTNGNGALVWSSTPSLTNYVDLTTAQTIGGIKTFSSDITVNGVSLGMGANSIDTNTLVGRSSLMSITTGFQNCVLGRESLKFTTTGSNNTSVGTYSMTQNITGNLNVAVGLYSLFNASNSENTGIGSNALFFTSTGANNTSLGSNSGSSNTTGSNNTFIGYNANSNNSGYTNSTAIGANANVTASNRIQLGDGSVTSINTSGTLTLDAVTYPKAHGTSGQVLTTTGSGTLTWTTVVTPTNTVTLTNKRITPRVNTTPSSAEIIIDTNTTDFYSITALAINTNISTSGLPTEGQRLWISITGSGTGTKTITWSGANFEASSIALPTSIVGTGRLDVGFVWNPLQSRLRCVGVC